MSRSERKLHKRALTGDEAAKQALIDMWSEYQGRTDLACFLCDQPAAQPIRTQIFAGVRCASSINYARGK